MIKTKVLRIWKKNDRNGFSDSSKSVKRKMVLLQWPHSLKVQEYTNALQLTNTPREQIKYTVCTYIANK